MESTYMLNCDNCGNVFASEEAFPGRHLCPRCLIVFKAGYKQSREEMDIQLTSLADLCLEHRKAGRGEGLECIKGEIEKVENDYQTDDDLAQYLAFNKAKQKILALFKEK